MPNRCIVIQNRAIKKKGSAVEPFILRGVTFTSLEWIEGEIFIFQISTLFRHLDK